MREKFGDRLRVLRTERDMKQSDLAAVFGLSASGIGSYERNLREPAYEHLIAFAEFFNVSTDYILGITGERMRAEDLARVRKVELYNLLLQHDVTIRGKELSDDDKKRICDIALAVAW